MKILNLWRQFGRRYFWYHLLLGMVATGIGAPIVLQSSAEGLHANNTLEPQSRQSQALWAFDSLFLKQQSQRTSPNVNYWQQHAVRNVIRQISFAFSVTHEADNENTNESLRLFRALTPKVMLDKLYAILTIAPSVEAPLSTDLIVSINTSSFKIFSPATWIATTQGIRAGPVSIS